MTASGSRRQASRLASALLAAALSAAAGSRAPLALPVRNWSNCLVNAVWDPSRRSMVTFDGVSMPINIGHYSWDSSRIAAEMFAILSREVLGVNAEVGPTFSSSKYGFQAVAGCQNELAGNPANARCGQPGEPATHIVIEAWDDYAASAMNYIQANHIDVYPIEQGSMGFPGRDGIYVADKSATPAMLEHHLPLEYYYSYSNPSVDVSRYFDSPWDIDTQYLTTCAERSATGFDGFLEAYYRMSGDNVSVNVSVDSSGQTTYTAVCDPRWPHWWLSPACRRNTSACIPFISASYGWYADHMMQRAYAWDIPVAISTGNVYSNYIAVPKMYRTIVYWWFPDSAFMDLAPKEIIWPPYDKSEHDRGNYRTDAGPGPTHKWSYFGLANRSNAGFNGPLSLLKNMEFGYQAIYDILSEVVKRGVDTPEKRRSFSCEWLNNNTVTWMRWKPEETACREGEGLISRTGSYVTTRAEASSCRWCTPGRFSSRLTDTMGVTYTCEVCPATQFQGSLGMTQCEECLVGQAPNANRSKCEFCALGKYATFRGMSACSSCPTHFTTDNPGSTSERQCVCEKGRYRSVNLKVCLACPQGMECAQGSDASAFTTGIGRVPLLLPGFWASDQAPVSIFRCASPERCPGNLPPGRACGPRLEGQSCGVCESGWVWQVDKCVECPPYLVSMIIFPVTPMVLVPIIIIVLYYFGRDPYDRWGSWRNGVASIMFIMLSHYQVVSILSGVDVMFPLYVKGLLRAFTVTSDVLSVFEPACVGMRSFTAITVLRCIGPLILAIYYAGTWGISQLLGRCRPNLKMDMNTALNGYFSLVMTFFLALSEVCFALFKCASNPNLTSSLLMDRSITCNEGEWNSLVGIGVIALLIWIGGFGSLFVKAIIDAPKKFSDPVVQKRWKFLFIRFRPDVHWWSIAIMMKAFMFNLGFTFISSGVGQILWILVLVNIYIGFEILYKPWRHCLNNGVDLWTHLNLCLSLSCAIWFAYDPSSIDSEDRTMVVSTFFMFCTFFVLPPLIPTVGLMYWEQNSASAATKKAQELAFIMDSFEQVHNVDEGTRKIFFGTLDETDYRFMINAKDILQTEFAKRHCRKGYSTKKLVKVPLGDIRELRADNDIYAIRTSFVKHAVQDMQYIDL